MITQLMPPQPRRAHSHPHAQPTAPLTAMPAQGGIQRPGSCGVRS